MASYEARVRAMEAQGMTRSDAQSVIDAEDLKTMNARTIAGVDFRAVRQTRPIPHWLPQVVETGFIYPCGIFKDHSRPAMWASMEYTAKRIGAERFRREALEAK